MWCSPIHMVYGVYAVVEERAREKSGVTASTECIYVNFSARPTRRTKTSYWKTDERTKTAGFDVSTDGRAKRYWRPVAKNGWRKTRTEIYSTLFACLSGRRRGTATAVYVHLRGYLRKPKQTRYDWPRRCCIAVYGLARIPVG